MNGSHILVVDDEPEIRQLLQEILEDEGYGVSTARSADEAREQRRARRPDLIILDIWMPGTDGVTLLKEWRESGGAGCPVIMVSGHGTVETAVEATRLGAYDYIEKPLSLSKILLTVDHALDQDRLLRENLGLRRQADATTEPIGSSSAIAALREQAQRIAEFDTPVLLLGEAGAGKRSTARYIHGLSARAGGPFVDLGAHTLARADYQADLFGSEHADEIRYGLLEQANGGVLYIEEITDLDLQTQAQLAATMQGQPYQRIGGREAVAVNVRVFAATQRDLEVELSQGRLREGFYYQLNVLPLKVPPLRERPEDVPELLEHYVDHHVQREGLARRRFTVAAQQLLRSYQWPGNVRELKNLVQRLLILGQGESIDAEEVELALGIAPAAVGMGADDRLPLHIDLPLREAREAFERAYLLRQLDVCGGKVGEVAKRAGIERTHLYRKLRSLSIDTKRGAKDES